MEGSSVALVGALGVIAGAVIGFLIARFSGSSNTESELVAAREALDQYRADVADHFKRSSGLIAEMTNSYRNVYQHMADGAQQLCSAEVARTIGETLQTQRLEDKRPAAPEGGAATATAAAPAAVATAAAPGATPQAADSAQSPAAQTDAPAAPIGESTATLTDSGPEETSAAPAHATAATEHASTGDAGAGAGAGEGEGEGEGTGADPRTAGQDHSEPRQATAEDVDTQATVLTRKAS